MRLAEKVGFFLFIHDMMLPLVFVGFLPSAPIWTRSRLACLKVAFMLMMARAMASQYKGFTQRFMFVNAY